MNFEEVDTGRGCGAGIARGRGECPARPLRLDLSGIASPPSRHSFAVQFGQRVGRIRRCPATDVSAVAATDIFGSIEGHETGEIVNDGR
jgi:hypothetical protein